MIINTKFNIGDYVWVVRNKHHNSEPENLRIKKIRIIERCGKTIIEYSFSDYGNSLYYEEHKLTKVKEG